MIKLSIGDKSKVTRIARVMRIFRGWLNFLLFIIIISWFCLVGIIYYNAKINDAQKADAIVVLGASQWGGRPSPVFQSRLDQAHKLSENGLASKIILTGGVGQGEEISEAMVGKLFLINKGIKEENIYIEEKGKTSWQSLNEANKILKEQNLQSIILISDGFHMMRLRKMAKDLDINFFSSPVKDGSVNKNKLTQFKYSIRESVVYLLYLVFGI